MIAPLSSFQADDSKSFQSGHQMSCCGVEGYKDFEKARPFMDQVDKLFIILDKIDILLLIL